MIGFGTSVTGAGLVGAGVAGYWAYTLGGVERLRPLLRRYRRGVMRAGLVVSGAGLLDPTSTVAAVVPFGAAGALYAYAARNQWLHPRPAPALVETRMVLPDYALVAVMPGGGAIPLRWAARLRTVRAGAWTLVHCGLARSVAVFRSPAAGPVAATLPHSTGFEIGAGSGIWDGVDGRSLDSGPDLVAAPVALCTSAAWHAAFPAEPVWAPSAHAPLPPRYSRRPLVPGARDVADPNRWGTAIDGAWTALADHELGVCPPHAGSTEGPAVAYLGRWAARRRGMRA